MSNSNAGPIEPEMTTTPDRNCYKRVVILGNDIPKYITKPTFRFFWHENGGHEKYLKLALDKNWDMHPPGAEKWAVLTTEGRQQMIANTNGHQDGWNEEAGASNGMVAAYDKHSK